MSGKLLGSAFLRPSVIYSLVSEYMSFKLETNCLPKSSTRYADVVESEFDVATLFYTDARTQ